jgi:hypothetical protein
MKTPIKNHTTIQSQNITQIQKFYFLHIYKTTTLPAILLQKDNALIFHKYTKFWKNHNQNTFGVEKKNLCEKNLWAINWADSFLNKYKNFITSNI